MSRRVCSPRIVGRLFVALAVMLLGSTLTLSQSSPTDSPAAAHMRALNNSLLSLHGHMQQADANSGRTLRAQAATAIAQRSAALGSLIQTDPHAALSFAFSAELLADLAAKVPQSSLWLESHATLSGPIERLTVDSADLKSSYSRLQMRVGQRRVGLHFAGPEPTYLLRANVVQVTGVLLGHEMAVASTTMVPATGSMVNTNNGPARLAGVTPVPASLRFLLTTAMTIIGVLTISVACVRDQLKQITIFALVFLLVISSSIENAAAASTCSTTGVQNTAVLVVNFQDVQNLATTQQISDAFFDTSSGRSLDGFWQESSAGRVSAVGNVFGPFTLAASTSYSCSNAIQIFYDAVSAAAAAGIHLQNYTRINVVLPSLSCGWAGFTMTGSAGAGCNLWSTSDGTLTASLSYEVDSYFTQATNAWPSARDQAVAVVSHENGHQLGLEHSGTISDQPAAVVGTDTAPGTHTEYGDDFSVMSNNNMGLYPAPFRAEVLNWMTAGSNYQVVQSSGTYTLLPFELNTSGLQALKVQRGTGNPGYYLWVEYRQPIGAYDTTLPTQPFSGALIHYEDPTTGSYTNLLDFVPGDTLKTSPALTAGQTWVDPYSDLSLTAVSATSSGLTVNVSYSGTTSCASANPTVNVSPLDPSIYAGQNASYNLTVTNNDSAGCSANTFNLDSTQPSGWPTSLSASSLTLSPGQSGSAVMYKTGPSGTPPGTYTVNVNTSNNSHASSGTANVTLMTPPSLAASVAVPATVFSLRSTIPISATVTNGGLPASGASVTFTLAGPSGAASQTATTNSSGTAAWSYKLGPRSLAGTYTVSAQASLSSGGRKASSIQTANSNTVTFTIQ